MGAEGEGGIHRSRKGRSGEAIGGPSRVEDATRGRERETVIFRPLREERTRLSNWSGFSSLASFVAIFFVNAIWGTP